MRRRLATLCAVSLLLVASVLVAPAAAAHPYCGITWGSRAKSAGDMSPGQVTDVRAGRHTCYDRLVLDVDAPLAGWSVGYVDEVIEDGSGVVVATEGGARLAVVAMAPAIQTDAFSYQDRRLIDTSGYRTFRDVQWAGSFEGMTTVGLGVRATLPFRAFVVDGPGEGSRLVVDVAHRWCVPGHRSC